MTEAWQRQRMAELREQGSVQALAFNEPNKLHEALSTPAREGEGELSGARGWKNED